MAVVVTVGGDRKTLKPEQGTAIWEVLCGEQEGTPEQQVFCEKIDRIYLNWRMAPDSYIQENLEAIIPMALSRWLVTRDGKPSRPWHSFDWYFAKRWGLWDENGMTDLAKRSL